MLFKNKYLKRIVTVGNSLIDFLTNPVSPTPGSSMYINNPGRVYWSHCPVSVSECVSLSGIGNAEVHIRQLLSPSDFQLDSRKTENKSKSRVTGWEMLRWLVQKWGAAWLRWWRGKAFTWWSQDVLESNHYTVRDHPNEYACSILTSSKAQ